MKMKEGDVVKNVKGKYVVAAFAFAFLLGVPILFFTVPSGKYVDFIIAVKGKEGITWQDFSRFPHADIGSGQYVFEYPLVEGSRLYLAGSKLESAPESVYIVRKDGTKRAISDVEE